MSQFCPSCGLNFTADAVVTIGRWVVSPDFARLDGNDLSLTPTEARVLHSVAAAFPGTVRREAVANRCSDADSADNVVSVMIVRLRHKLGGNFPIETLRGVGLRWREAA